MVPLDNASFEVDSRSQQEVEMRSQATQQGGPDPDLLMETFDNALKELRKFDESDVGLLAAELEDIVRRAVAIVSLPTALPTAPTGVAGTAEDGAVALSWAVPPFDGGAPITGYRITPYLGPAAQKQVLTGSAATAFTVTGLTNGSAYTFTVAACNRIGTGHDSAASAAVTPVKTHQPA
jgi:hypothetical protein